LGEGCLRLINDNLYIGNGRWLFRLYSPELHIPQQVLDLAHTVEDLEGNHVLDYRVLNARSIDVKNESFLPAGMRKHHPLYIRLDSRLPADGDEIEEMFESTRGHAEEPRLDLMSLYRSGEMRTVYEGAMTYDPNKELGARRTKLAKASKASAYFYEGDEVVVGVPAALMEMLSSLDFDLWIPMEKENEIPTIGGWNNELRAEILLGPVSDLHVTHTPDGRKLNSRKGCMLCWWTEERAMQEVNTTVGFDPTRYDQKKVISAWLSGEINHPHMGIDALRWQGVPEDMIRTHLEKVQEASWPVIYKGHMETADRLMTRIIEETASDKVIPDWQVRSWKSELERLCNFIEAMQPLVEEELSLGVIPEIAEALQEVEVA